MLNSHSIKSTAGLKCLILPLHIFLCDYTTYSTVFISSASRGERTLIYFGIAILFLTSLRARDIHTEDRKQRCSESGGVPIKVPEMLSIRAYWSAQFRALPADSIQPIRIDESKITHSSNSHTHTTGLDLGIFISYISGTHTHTQDGQNGMLNCISVPSKSPLWSLLLQMALSVSLTPADVLSITQSVAPLRLRAPKIRSHYPDPTTMLKLYSAQCYANCIPGHF